MGINATPVAERLHIGFFGKRNAGKSSVMNRVTGQNLAVVSEIKGTTTDPVYKTMELLPLGPVMMMDTPGMDDEGDLGSLRVEKSYQALRKADLAVMVLDGTRNPDEEDEKVLRKIQEKGIPYVVAVNKWDAIEKNDKTIYKHTNRIREVLSFMPYAEIVFISARTGLRISRMFETLDAVIENQTMRIQTGVLNEILAEAVAMQQPPSDRGRRLKIFYMTQVAVKPPTFVIFVNDKELMHFSYTRYLENKIRDAFDFGGTPLKFIVRERGEKE